MGRDNNTDIESPATGWEVSTSHGERDPRCLTEPQRSAIVYYYVRRYHYKYRVLHDGARRFEWKREARRYAMESMARMAGKNQDNEWAFFQP